MSTTDYVGIVCSMGESYANTWQVRTIPCVKFWLVDEFWFVPIMRRHMAQREGATLPSVFVQKILWSAEWPNEVRPQDVIAINHMPYSYSISLVLNHMGCQVHLMSINQWYGGRGGSCGPNLRFHGFHMNWNIEGGGRLLARPTILLIIIRSTLKRKAQSRSDEHVAQPLVTWHHMIESIAWKLRLRSYWRV